MNVRFERAFDDLIASHDVSDEAIDRLYDGSPNVVTPLDIRYGLICGDVAPVNMGKFLARANARRQESQERAERYRRYEEEQAKIKARVEAERKRQREEKHNHMPMAFTPGYMTSVAPPIRLPDFRALSPQAIIDRVHSEFLSIVMYAESRIRDIERTIDDAKATEKILGVSHITESYNTALHCFRELEASFKSSDGAGWRNVVEKITNGEISTYQMAVDYARSFKHNAKVAGSQYEKQLRYSMNKAKDHACGELELKYDIYNEYRGISIRMRARTTLYVMKAMCEVFGNTDMYDSTTGILTVPIGKGVQYTPADLSKIESTEYHCPIVIVWATNTICDSSYDIIVRRSIRDYYQVHNMNSSDMLYIGYGMHCLSQMNGLIAPALVYEFKYQKFAQRCRTIYLNEKAIKRISSIDPKVKAFYMEKYFHERNIRYVGFDGSGESWETLADDIAKFSTKMLAKYKGGGV